MSKKSLKERKQLVVNATRMKDEIVQDAINAVIIANKTIDVKSLKTLVNTMGVNVSSMGGIVLTLINELNKCHDELEYLKKLQELN